MHGFLGMFGHNLGSLGPDDKSGEHFCLVEDIQITLVQFLDFVKTCCLQGASFSLLLLERACSGSLFIAGE